MTVRHLDKFVDAFVVLIDMYTHSLLLACSPHLLKKRMNAHAHARHATPHHAQQVSMSSLTFRSRCRVPGVTCSALEAMLSALASRRVRWGARAALRDISPRVRCSALCHALEATRSAVACRRARWAAPVVLPRVRCSALCRALEASRRARYSALFHALRVMPTRWARLLCNARTRAPVKVRHRIGRLVPCVFVLVDMCAHSLLPACLLSTLPHHKRTYAHTPTHRTVHREYQRAPQLSGRLL